MDKLFEFYFEGKDRAFIDSVMDKAKVIGYTRGLRRTIKRNPDQSDLIAYYKEKLIEYVSKTDTLTY